MTKNYKLVVSDLDGTLVPYCTNDVSPMTVAMVHRLRQSGVEFVIATGRSWAQTKPIVDRLEITAPVIVQAGALVIDPLIREVLRVQPLGPELEMLLRRLEPPVGVDQLCLLGNGTYYATHISTQGGKWMYRHGEECCLVPEWLHSPTEVIKHLFIGSKRKLEQIASVIRDQIAPLPNLVFWPPDQTVKDWFLEVFDPLSSKGQALQWLAAQMGIGLDEVVAFGDGTNDLDMLRLAGLGVAIAGAPPEVMAAADEIAPGPEMDGVARFIDRLTVGMGAAGIRRRGVANRQ